MLSQQCFTWLVIAGLKLLVIAGALSAALQHGDSDSLASSSQSTHESLSQTGFMSAGYSRNCGRGPKLKGHRTKEFTEGIDPTADSDLTQWVPLSDYEREWTELPIDSAGPVKNLKP